METPPPDLIKAMHASEILDFVFDAWVLHKKQHTRETLDRYNWWVDVYNFKRGKLVLQTHQLQRVEAKLKFEDHYGKSLRA